MKVEGRVTLAPPGTARHTVPVSCRESRCALAAQLPSADGNPRGAPRYRTRGRAASAAPWGFLGPRCGPRNDIKWGRASAMSSTPIGLAIPNEPRAAPASLAIPSEPRAAAWKEAEGGSRGERHLHPLAPPARAGVRWQRSCQVQVGIPEARRGIALAGALPPPRPGDSSAHGVGLGMTLSGGGHPGRSPLPPHTTSRRDGLARTLPRSG